MPGRIAGGRDDNLCDFRVFSCWYSKGEATAYFLTLPTRHTLRIRDRRQAEADTVRSLGTEAEMMGADLLEEERSEIGA
jgi:hypothetical protein